MDFITANFRFYAELNDFLSPQKRKGTFTHTFAPGSSVKDIIESLGVPHTDIDLILVNGKSVDFSYQVQKGDEVSVYPVFESLDITSVTRLRPQVLRVIRFVLDVHLGKLAKYLRLLGFDTVYDINYRDKDIIQIAIEQKRIILTRDVGLLKNKKVTHGYWLRETDPKLQVNEILSRFDLNKKCKPFTRCLECNGEIVRLEKLTPSDIQQLPNRVKEKQKHFYQCVLCKRFYWQGTHYAKLATYVDSVLKPQI